MTDQDEMMTLPDVARVGAGAPLRWLGKGWRDFWAPPLPCLAFGVLLAGLSAALAWPMYFSGYFAFVFVLAGGFFLVAPMLAMGLYAAARKLSLGQTPGLSDILLVKGAFRRDLAYLGLALLMIYLLWTRIAQIVYALSSPRVHKTPDAFLTFMLHTPEGQLMALIGTGIGAGIAFLAYTLIVVSAPMLLDTKRDVFTATVTSVRCVLRNPAAMIVWALLIGGLTAFGIATAFAGLAIVFPVIGLASWHAYRELVPDLE